MSDNVNHPTHYTKGGIEAIEVIEAWELGFCLGNTVKYISRAGRKDPSKELEDLRKARWYLDRHIERLVRNAPDPLHPTGQCTCYGAGECAWCNTACPCCGGLRNAEPLCECGLSESVTGALGLVAPGAGKEAEAD